MSLLDPETITELTALYFQECTLEPAAVWRPGRPLDHIGEALAMGQWTQAGSVDVSIRPIRSESAPELLEDPRQQIARIEAPPAAAGAWRAGDVLRTASGACWLSRDPYPQSDGLGLITALAVLIPNHIRPAVLR